MREFCEVPACPERAVEVMVVLGAGPLESVSMCGTHAIEWATPVTPAPPRVGPPPEPVPLEDEENP